MTERGEKAKVVFMSAIEKHSADQWPAFLDGACGDDVELRGRVEELLQAHVDLGSIHASGASPTIDEPLSEQAGTQIGPFKLLQKLGEGGMGVVFMAEQNEPVRRTVALKIIKPGMDTRQVIARFEAERQALAMMDHPHIAKVLDGGTTESGRPFFAMELVKGIPITQYCDEHRLPLQQRLQLFVDVCHAVQHAHQKGIIHRDLKPSNVLITEYDDQAVPKIIDFGVAKAIQQRLTEKTMFTQLGQVVGTPEYMSPEQAKLNQLDIDTRSDIYSLGVLLYELLTGETPFDRQRLQSAAFDEMLRILREEEPPRPSLRLSSSQSLPSIAANRHVEPKRLSTLLRGELDWIVMKALEKERPRRYETANGFAADVLHYLHDEPVQACPPSAAYRFRKVARRYKGPLTAAALLLVALMTVAIGAGFAAARFRQLANHNATLVEKKAAALEAETRAASAARDAQRAAEAARSQERSLRREAERQKEQAATHFASARSAVDEFFQRVSENQQLTVPGLRQLRSELISSALEFYDDFAQDESSANDMLRELARAFSRIARIRDELGESAESEDANARAIELYERLRADNQEDADVSLGLAEAYYRARRYGDAVTLYQEMLAVESEHVEARSRLANAYDAWGLAASKQSDVQTALEYHRQAQALREKLVESFPENKEYHAQLGQTLHHVGVLLTEQGDDRQALTSFERAVAAFQQTPPNMTWGRWHGSALQQLGVQQAASGRQEEALQSFEQATASCRKLVFRHPAVPALKADLYRAWMNLSSYQRQRGDTSAARRSSRAAQQLLEDIPRTTPPEKFELALVYAALSQPLDGSAASPQEKQTESRKYADLSLQTLQAAIEAGFRNRQALQSDESLAALRGRDDFRQLLVRLDEMVRLEQELSNDPRLSEGRPGNRAAQVLRQLIGSDATDLRRRKTLAATLHAVGEVQAGLKQYAEAEQTLVKACRLGEETLAQMSEPGPEAVLDLLASKCALGQVYWNSGRGPAAHQLLQRVVQQLKDVTAAHGDSVAIQKSAATLERRICDAYGQLGLWPLAAEFASRNAQEGRMNDLRLDGHVIPLILFAGTPDDHRQYLQRYAEYFRESLSKQRSRSQRLLQLVIVWNCCLTEESLVDPSELIKVSRQALEDIPTMDHYQLCLALAQYRSGDFEGAAATLTRNRFSSDFRVSHHVLTRAFLEALLAFAGGDEAAMDKALGEAESLYRQVIVASLETTPVGLAARFRRYWWELFYAQQLRAEAWRKIRGSQPEHDPWQHLLQARGYRFIGETEKSNAELAAAVQAAPEDVDVWGARIRIRLESGDPLHVVEADWERAVACAGDDPLPWIRRGRWYAEQGKHEQADADFAQAASLTPDELNKFLEAGWWVVGPCPPGLDAFGLPELDPDPSKPVPVVDPANGFSGEAVAWRAAPADETGHVQLGEFDGPAASSVYLMTFVYAPTDRTMTLRTTKWAGQPNPAYRVWVNGEPCRSANWKPQWFGKEFLITPLVLREGRNVILVKSSGSRKGDNFPIRLSDHPVERALDLLRAGLMDDAEELLAARYTNQLQDEWLHLSENNIFAGRRHPKIRSALLQSDEVTDSTPLQKVASVVFLPEHAVPEKVLLDVAKEYDTASQLAQRPWSPRFLAVIYLRIQRWEDVLRILQQSQVSNAWELSMSAIACHHLGQSEKGRRMLALSMAALNQEVEAAKQHGDLANRIRAKSLSRSLWFTREAQATLEGDAQQVDELYEQFLLHRRKQWDARDPATAAFDDLVLIMPEQAESYLTRGRRRAQLGRWEEAEADFGRAMELAPQDYRPLLARAELNVQRGQISEATDDFSAALKLANKEDRIQHGRLVEAAVRRHAAVLDELTNRQDPNWRRLAGQRESLLGNWNEAARVLADSPSYTDAISLAAVQSVSGDTAGYQETVERLPQLLTEQLDEEAERHYWQAISLGLRGESDSATVTEMMRLAQLAADANPNDPRYPFAVGLAHFRRQQYQAAVDPLQQSLKVPVQDVDDLTDHAMAWAVLVMACHHLDRPDEADEWLARCDRWRDLSTRRAIIAFEGNDRAGRGLGDHRWNLANALTREAELLINGAEAVAEAEEQRRASLAALAKQTAAESQTGLGTE